MKKRLLVILIILVVAVLTNCINGLKPVATKQAAYVGTAQCQQCHQQAYKDFASSDHFHAMDSAVDKAVKGDFNNRFFVYYGDTSFFYKKGNDFYIRTKDSTGKATEFKISYTFGWQPLQQYLVQFPDGRIQSLPYCWDTRPKEKGGQRWFHLYNKENILPGDELFWMRANHNWNYMCADCHTTDYKTNFEIDNNSFHSKWSEQRVSCESCHGPASGHIEWASSKDGADSLKGFINSLAVKKTQWVFNQDKGIAYPKEIINNTRGIETCARCHSRATRFSDDYRHGESLLQTHLPANIDSGIYYMDGQVKDEDFEYGSFLQSKMYAQGVSCVNCHNPHSGRVIAAGNQLCSSCHSDARFNTPTHTRHLVGSTGAQCINCHMPVTTYMVVDDRRDHSFSIPRPDLSATLGSPNACNKCHTDKPVSWAASNFSKWYGNKFAQTTTYGELLSLISKRAAGSEAALYQLLTSPVYPAVIKTAALHQYNHYTSKRITDQTRLYLKSADPAMRLSGVQALAGLQEAELLPTMIPVLGDPVRLVRFEALNALAPLYGRLDEAAKAAFDRVAQEYLAVQVNMSHRPEAVLNRAVMLSSMGKSTEAEQVYLQGINRFPASIALYINLADLYRSLEDDAKAKVYLDKALAIRPGDPFLQYSTGLWYIRNKQQVAGMASLKKAATLAPANASFVYAYAIGLYSTGEPTRALDLLEKFLAGGNNDPLIFEGLISIYKDLNKHEKAEHYLQLRNKIFQGY